MITTNSDEQVMVAMAYDEVLAERIRELVGGNVTVAEIKMFGGLCFTLAGHMFCGIVGDELMVRVGPTGHDNALAEPNVRAMDFTGKPMKGYVFVAPQGVASGNALRKWVNKGLGFAVTLPPKQPRKRRAATTPGSRGRRA